MLHQIQVGAAQVEDVKLWHAIATGPPHVSPSTHTSLPSLSSAIILNGAAALQADTGGAGSQAQLHEPEDGDIQTVRHPDTPYSSAKSFDELPLNQELLQVIHKLKVEIPFCHGLISGRIGTEQSGT